MGKSKSNITSQTKRRLLHLHHSQTGRWIQVTSHSQRSLSSLDGWMKTIDLSITKICIIIINTVIATIITFSIIPPSMVPNMSTGPLLNWCHRSGTRCKLTCRRGYTLTKWGWENYKKKLQPTFDKCSYHEWSSRFIIGTLSQAWQTKMQRGQVDWRRGGWSNP